MLPTGEGPKNNRGSKTQKQARRTSANKPPVQDSVDTARKALSGCKQEFMFQFLHQHSIKCYSSSLVQEQCLRLIRGKPPPGTMAGQQGLGKAGDHRGGLSGRTTPSPPQGPQAPLPRTWIKAHWTAERRKQDGGKDALVNEGQVRGQERAWDGHVLGPTMSGVRGRL